MMNENLITSTNGDCSKGLSWDYASEGVSTPGSKHSQRYRFQTIQKISKHQKDVPADFKRLFITCVTMVSDCQNAHI